MRESIIQSQIKKYLEANGWMVIKLIQTSVNGIPDLICHKSGETVYMEIKQPGNKPTDLQNYRHKQIRNHGIEVIGCATCINDVKHLCNG